MIGLVWLTSVLYSTPKFLFVQTITNKLGNETGDLIWIYGRLGVIVKLTLLPWRRIFSSLFFFRLHRDHLYSEPARLQREALRHPQLRSALHTSTDGDDGGYRFFMNFFRVESEKVSDWKFVFPPLTSIFICLGKVICQVTCSFDDKFITFIEPHKIINWVWSHGM